MTVRHEQRNWDVKVGFDKDPDNWRFFVTINGVHQDKLPEAPKTVKNLPPTCRSALHENYSEYVR